MSRAQIFSTILIISGFLPIASTDASHAASNMDQCPKTVQKTHAANVAAFFKASEALRSQIGKNGYNSLAGYQGGRQSMAYCRAADRQIAVTLRIIQYIERNDCFPSGTKENWQKDIDRINERDKPGCP